MIDISGLVYSKEKLDRMIEAKGNCPFYCDRDSPYACPIQGLQDYLGAPGCDAALMSFFNVDIAAFKGTKLTLRLKLCRMLKGEELAAVTNVDDVYTSIFDELRRTK